VLQNVDVLVLSTFASASEVGIYFAALKTISLITFLNYAVGSAVAGELAALKARGDKSGLVATIQRTSRWTFWPALGGATALLALGTPLLRMFGSDFALGYPIMFILAIGLVVRAAVGPAEFVLRMLGEQKSCAIVLGVTAALDTALCVLLVREFGLIGAAIANASSMVCASLLFYIVARRRLGVDISIFARTYPPTRK
jgi:O-antigen/teichoic acid export membrane protein